MRPSSKKAERATQFFLSAKDAVLAAGYQNEIHWQESVSIDQLSEQSLLRELAWVILNSGFREATVRKLFPHISLAFYDWNSAADIVAENQSCVELAFDVFRNTNKLNAIVSAAEGIHSIGFAQLKSEICKDPLGTLLRFKYVGHTTVWHLAKNLGCDVAKPDRHLVRLSKEFGYSDVHKLCRDIANLSNEKVSVVDIVLWRHAVLIGRGAGTATLH